MKLSALGSALVLAGSAAASPQWWAPQNNQVTHWLLPYGIVTPKYAQHIVDEIISIFGHAEGANATANALLADDFAEFSDSILALQSRPVPISLKQTDEMSSWS